jgi:hypothetical protein
MVESGRSLARALRASQTVVESNEEESVDVAIGGFERCRLEVVELSLADLGLVIDEGQGYRDSRRS